MTTGIDAILFPPGSEEFVGANSGVYDISIGNNGDIRTQDFFDTAIMMSIFGERRANISEVLNPRLRKGWIGNESTPGFEIGSKVWLYEQSRLTRTVINGIENAARESLIWLVTDGFAASIDKVNATLSGTSVLLDITITRPNGKVEKRHFNLWENTGLRIADTIIGPDITIEFNAIGSDSQNMFTLAGSPEYQTNVLLLLSGKRGTPDTSTPAVTTGTGWHPNSILTLILLPTDNGNALLSGCGGVGGLGASTGIGGNSGGGGGGGAGRLKGQGGDGGASFITNGSPGSFFGDGGAGGSGTTGSANVAARSATNGLPGGPGIELLHPLRVRNLGHISGGAGGGGGGLAEKAGGIGGGNTLDSQLNGYDAPDFGGGLGGPGGAAFVTNGYKLTLEYSGSIIGDII